MEPVRVCIFGQDDVLVRSLAMKIARLFGFYLRDLTRSSTEGTGQALKTAEREYHILFALRDVGVLPKNSFNINLLEEGSRHSHLQEEIHLCVYARSLLGEERTFHIRDTLLRKFPQLKLVG